METNLKENLVWLNTPFDSKTVKVIDYKNDQSDFVSYFIDAYAKSQQNILFFGSAQDLLSILDISTVNLTIDIRIKNKVSHNVITFDKLFETIDNAKILREVKTISKPTEYISSYNVFDDSVLVWNSRLPSCIIIRDLATVRMMRLQFELLWSTLK